MSPETVVNLPISETQTPETAAADFNLSRLGITVDKYNRAHDATNGRFMKLSVANVETLDKWQDFIVENTPPTEAESVNRFTEPVVVLEDVSFLDRAKRRFRWAKNEVQLMPRTAVELAAKGFGKAFEWAGRSPRRAWALGALGAVAIVGNTGAAIAGAKYGYSGGSAEKHELFAELTRQHLGATALSSPTKHHLWSQLHYDPLPPHGSEHHKDIVDGFHTDVFVEHSHGFTDEFQDLAAQKDITLPGDDAWRIYLDTNPRFHGHYFTNDPPYLRDAGDFGISRPGPAHFDPHFIPVFEHELEKLGDTTS